MSGHLSIRVIGIHGLRLRIRVAQRCSSRLHFIPLSPSYKEIYNIFAYFSGPTQSMLEAANSTLALLSPEERYSAQDAELRKIAEAGKQWKKTIGRTLDMEGEYRVHLPPSIGDGAHANPSLWLQSMCIDYA